MVIIISQLWKNSPGKRISGLYLRLLSLRCLYGKRSKRALPHVKISKWGELSLGHCRYAQDLWKLGPWNDPFDPNLVVSIKALIVGLQSRKNLSPYGISINLLPWLFWSIWCSRNQLLFLNRLTYLSIKLLLLAREWEKAQSSSSGRSISHQILSLLPSEITISIRYNTCAAWRSDSSTASISWIFASPSSSELNQGSMIQLHVSSPLLAEALALREALLQATSLNITDIWIRSNSQALVREFNRKRGPSELHRTPMDIIGLSSSFVLCFLSFVSRNFNGPANVLAKSCLNNLLSVKS